LHYGESFDLPELKGVDSTRWALKKDAEDYKLKWDEAPMASPEKLGPLVDESAWRLAEDHKSAREQDALRADARVRTLEEKMQMMPLGEPLSDPRRPATMGGMGIGDRTLDEFPLSPGSVTMEENARLRRELVLRDNRVASLEAAFVSYVSAKSKVLSRDKWMKDFAITSRLQMHNTAVILQVCGAWANAAIRSRQLREQEEQSAQDKALLSDVRARCVEYTQTRQDILVKSALLALCMSAWTAEVGSELLAKCQGQVELMNQQITLARKRMAPRLERWLDTQGKQAVSECFADWAGASRKRTSDRVQRDLEETRKLIASTEKALLESKMLVERFSKSAVRQLRQKVNADQGAVQQMALAAWNRALQDARKQRELEAARARARQMSAEARERAIRLAMGGADMVLKQTVYLAWLEVQTEAKNALLQKTKAMDKARRAINGSDQDLQGVVLGIWVKVTKDEQNLRAVAAAEAAAREANARSREQKLKVAQMAFAGMDSALLQSTTGAWSMATKTAILNKDKRQQNMARCLRGIANSDELLLRSCVTPWGEMVLAIRKKREGKEKTMARILRQLDESGFALLGQINLMWARITADGANERRLRMHQEESEEAKARARAQKLAAVERCFASEGQALLATSLRAWYGEYEAVKKAKELHERLRAKGMDATLKKIVGAEREAMGTCFQALAADAKNERMLKQLHEAELAAQRVQAARERAIAMFEKSMNSTAEGLIVNILGAWANEKDQAKKRRARKDQVMARTLRDIAGSEELLRSLVWQTWMKMSESARDLMKHRVRMQRCVQIGRTVVVRLRDQILIRIAWDAWTVRALV